MCLASRIPFGSPRLSKLTSHLSTSEGKVGEELADSMTLHLSIEKERKKSVKFVSMLGKRIRKQLLMKRFI